MSAQSRRISLTDVNLLKYSFDQRKNEAGNKNGDSEKIISLSSIDSDYSYVRRDLIKIAVLSALIIGLQIILKFLDIKI